MIKLNCEKNVAWDSLLNVVRKEINGCLDQQALVYFKDSVFQVMRSHYLNVLQNSVFKFTNDSIQK